MNDMTSVIVPKSDQISADDLIAGPLTIQITGVEIRPGTEQPVSVKFDGDGGRPWKPCKSMSRVLVEAWGPDASKYVGRSATLYRDPTVMWGGMAVGGIRVSHLSDIPREMKLLLTVTKAKRAPYKVLPLVPQQASGGDGALVLLDSKAVPRRVSPTRWLEKMGEVLGKLESADAVQQWRMAMGEHIAEVAATDNEMARAADRLIVARLAELEPAEREPGEDE